ncbi:MAG: PD40 domain-containing protein [Anaerolineae bacterium]|nr:PD40 domain-containing protein [Anaerolineae bacterium]
MPTDHVTSLLEAYLDDRLSSEERRSVEAHLAFCQSCREQLHIARRLVDELKPTMLAALGQPALPPALRQRVRRAVNTPQPWSFNWTFPGRVLNTLGTAAVISLLAFGVWTVIRGQLLGADIPSEIVSLSPSSDSTVEQIVATTPTPTPLSRTTPAPTLTKSSVSDTLKSISTPVIPANSESGLEMQSIPLSQPENEPITPPQPTPPAPTHTPEPPAGTIAFAYFNQAPGRQVYETHLINADGTNPRLFPLDGVSEPALRFADGEYQLAYRAYHKPTSPRSLLSGDVEGKVSYRVGGFFEDAQPDWSPKEYRLIYASQREVDRRWRLYTSWGDGDKEINLRREGESPTFAPDGFHFAFITCDNTGNRCGIWVGDLGNSEYGSQPILENRLAKSPDWSPVSAEIAYMANPGDNWDLYVVDSNGENVRRLTDDPAIDGLPAWSPDGKWLAFLSNREGNWGIWLLHVATGETRRIFSFEGGVFTPPNEPPYGQRDWYDEQLSWSE